MRLMHWFTKYAETISWRLRRRQISFKVTNGQRDRSQLEPSDFSLMKYVFVISWVPYNPRKNYEWLRIWISQTDAKGD